MTTLKTAFEFLGSAIFAILMMVQIGMLMMVGLARLLRSLGYFKDGEEERGWRGFLRGFS